MLRAMRRVVALAALGLAFSCALSGTAEAKSKKKATVRQFASVVAEVRPQVSDEWQAWLNVTQDSGSVDAPFLGGAAHLAQVSMRLDEMTKAFKKLGTPPKRSGPWCSELLRPWWPPTPNSLPASESRRGAAS